jgi:hypothetical protein
MKRNLLAVIVLFLSCSHVFGQISTDEEPVSFRMDIPVLQRSEKAQKSLPSLNMRKIEQEDIEDEANGMPPRFGYKYEVNYNLENSGEWTNLPDGSKIWRLVISSPGALSINLLYDKFWIPDGAKFFIYSNDRKHSIGAFTSANNKGDSKDIQGFATGLVYSDRVTLEYWLPKQVKDIGNISIAYVVHGYRYILLPDSEKAGYGQSGSCNININCNQGQGWQNEKNAIAMILVNGNRWCTGSLVNTTANDNRPLFLTANHCLTGGSDAITSPNLSHWSFYWHYESPGCTNAVPTIRSTSGATVVANNGASDFALLRLTEDPRSKTGVTPYYLGWDRSGNSGTGGVGIHHPNGDIKKISIYTAAPQSTGYLNNTVNANGNHWRVLWSSGTTEGGSSGSPLINNDRRVIGQLHGGYASCSALTSPDWYGKLSVSWTGNGATDSRRRLRDWLDPAGSNPATLDGSSIPTITGSSLVCYSPTQFALENPPAGTITWSVTGPFTVSGSGTMATVIATGASNEGGTLTATIGIVTVNKTIMPCPFPVITAPDIICWGGNTITAANWQPGYTWAASNNLVTIACPSCYTTTISAASSNARGGVMLSVKNSSGVTLATKINNWVGTPSIHSVSQGTIYGYYDYEFIPSVWGVIEYYAWSVGSWNGGSYDIQLTEPTRLIISLYDYSWANYTIGLEVANSCGVGGYAEYSMGYSPVSAYPNPASTTLNIEIDAQALAQSSAPATTSGKQLKQDKTYDIRLYDNQGTLLRNAKTKGGNIQFNVAGLPDGIYYLHIYDGVSGKPEIRQIVVEH